VYRQSLLLLQSTKVFKNRTHIYRKSLYKDQFALVKNLKNQYLYEFKQPVNEVKYDILHVIVQIKAEFYYFPKWYSNTIFYVNNNKTTFKNEFFKPLYYTVISGLKTKINHGHYSLKFLNKCINVSTPDASSRYEINNKKVHYIKTYRYRNSISSKYF